MNDSSIQPGTLPMAPSVAGRYAALVAAGEIDADPAQQAVVGRLDHLNSVLGDVELASKKSSLGWLFGKRRAPADPVKGLYIWGSVGRGKTMLMDLFFEVATVRRKRRVHFHEFMEDVHDRVHRTRLAIKAGTIKGSDPIPPVAAEIAEETRLLCFDEFAVTDIADAMILGRLFTHLFDLGVVVVATSNVDPQDLYRDGLNRGHFMGFISLLQARVDVMRLDARTDYRLEKLAGAAVYVTPLGAEADAAMEGLWRKLTHGMTAHAEELEAKGRKIAVPRTVAGVARFTFAELCERPLSAADYLRIAHAYHTIVLEGVPVMALAQRNAAKRLINLVDALYDNRIKLVVSAAAEPDGLYTATTGAESFEFARTASRLIEMRSEAWLAGSEVDTAS
ncbi:cell division protein ZapE [Stappia sp. F7233]|uniref:Cell division protein ZapE n=1 Tax=Stappia albiluteola TaxID=2758565 RepID=A0A839ABZ0_9HYPH|nr:cell division protein ZapE [Stappia albiluteola]MBA5776951.1 cell division protein ZapE [Stappia albiluteola]